MLLTVALSIEKRNANGLEACHYLGRKDLEDLLGDYLSFSKWKQFIFSD
jgi:hypothetical protein